MKRIDSVEDLTLELTKDSEDCYFHKQFILHVDEMEIVLDGIQVGDIIADAKDAGMPVVFTPIAKEGQGKPMNESD